ncbi:MAG: hypothetical protein VR68_05660 [Peptococcaceae bacterium BRH_c4a]|nr:MAG: hypothetical protein VR68_05660 [Peptococcaceae bacterium BRH_c4a]
MSDIKVEKPIDSGNYIEEKVTMDNTPDLNDKTGEVFLSHMEDAIKQCRKLVGEGFRLVDFWSDPDQGIQFILKKKK